MSIEKLGNFEKIKKKQSHKKCNHYYQNERCHGKSRTKNNSYSRHTHVCWTTNMMLLD